MVVSLNPTRRIRDLDTLEEGQAVEIVYQKSWDGGDTRCHGTVEEIMGPEHDQSYVIDPDDSSLTAVTVHARNSSAGTVDGESVHDIALATPDS